MKDLQKSSRIDMNTTKNEKFSKMPSLREMLERDLKEDLKTIDAHA